GEDVDDGGLDGPPQAQAFGGHRRGQDQRPGRGDLPQRRGGQVADRLADGDESGGGVGVDAGLVGHDPGLDLGRGEAELDGHEPLPGRVFQVLEDALVAGVVGDDELEARLGVEDDTEAVDGQLAAVVGQRVDDDGGVLAGFDHFVEVADGSFPDG